MASCSDSGFRLQCLLTLFCFANLFGVVHGKQSHGTSVSVSPEGQQSLLQAGTTSRKIQNTMGRAKQSDVQSTKKQGGASDQSAPLMVQPMASQTIPSMTEQLPGQPPNTQAWSSDQATGPMLQPLSRSPKFYMPLQGKSCANTVDVNKKIIPGSGTLKDFTDWLWTVDEVLGFKDYIMHRLACSNELVNSSEEADLCFPFCNVNDPSQVPEAARTLQIVPKANTKPFDKRKRDVPRICFEVAEQKRAAWKHCSFLCLGEEPLYEPEASLYPPRCSMIVPYLHGIVWPHRNQDDPRINVPWEFNFERTSMLTFVGASTRGLSRDAVLGAMLNEAVRINAVAPYTVFSAHIIEEGTKENANAWYDYGRTPQFYLDTWAAYASANFSWQPRGDTPTRRAFYESLILGCIPVIDQESAAIYRHLFNGELWIGVALEDIVVVIPEGKELDGAAILQMVASLPVDEFEKRHSKLRQIAPSLQWGQHSDTRELHNGDSDAFAMAMRSFNSGHGY